MVQESSKGVEKLEVALDLGCAADNLPTLKTRNLFFVALPISGPESLTFGEVCAIISEEIGRPLPY
jgi:hypothetical protein